MFKSLMLLTPLALLLAAGPALACIDVDMGFTPDVAHFGDRVTFHASIANTTGHDLVVNVSLSLAVGDLGLGPVTVPVPLAAGRELSGEFSFTVPRLPVTGTIAITVSAESGDYEDTATASLTIVGDADAADGLADLQLIGDGIMAALTTPMPVEPMTLGAVKALYR